MCADINPPLFEIITQERGQLLHVHIFMLWVTTFSSKILEVSENPVRTETPKSSKISIVGSKSISEKGAIAVFE